MKILMTTLAAVALAACTSDPANTSHDPAVTADEHSNASTADAKAQAVTLRITGMT